MKIMSDQDLIALGLNVQTYRRKGGMAVLKKYGKDHFAKLGKLSADKKKKAKNEAILST